VQPATKIPTLNPQVADKLDMEEWNSRFQLRREYYKARDDIEDFFKYKFHDTFPATQELESRERLKIEVAARDEWDTYKNRLWKKLHVPDTEKYQYQYERETEFFEANLMPGGFTMASHLMQTKVLRKHVRREIRNNEEAARAEGKIYQAHGIKPWHYPIFRR
jgi:hypothetical protein